MYEYTYVYRPADEVKNALRILYVNAVSSVLYMYLCKNRSLTHAIKIVAVVLF